MKQFAKKFKEGTEAFSATNVHMWLQKACEIAIEKNSAEAACHVQDGGWIEDALTVDSERFIQWIEETFPDMVPLSIHSQWDCIYSVVYVSDTDVVIVQRAPNDSTNKQQRVYKDKASIDIISLRPELAVSRDAQKFVAEFLTLERENHAEEGLRGAAVYVLNPTPTGMTFESGGDYSSEFFEDNYAENLVDLYHDTISNFHTDDPDGRLTVLVGPPGTGKTHFIRALIGGSNPDNVLFVSLDARSLLQVTEPGMFNFFYDFRKNNANKKMVFFVDDADEILGRRSGFNNDAVTKMLQLCDGFFADRLDTRIICSTNITEMDLDPAITRPGRLHRAEEFKNLSKEKATKVFKRLMEIEDESDPRLKEFEFRSSQIEGQKSGAGFSVASGGRGMSLAEVYAQAKTLRPTTPTKPKKVFDWDNYKTRRSLYQKRYETKQVYMDNPTIDPSIRSDL